MAPGKRLSEAQTMPSISKRKFELLDPDILECPICSEDLAPPVYQCPSGHITCEDCREKLDGKKCPCCQQPIGNNRCIAVEKILESLLVSCKNSVYGCSKMLGYTRRAEHETTSCEYQPFNCILHGCKFEGSIHSLPLHFKGEHQMQTLQPTDQFIMKPSDDYVFFHGRFHHHLLVLHREKQKSLGDKFFCASFGPFAGWLKLVVRVKDGCGSYTFETRGCDVRKGDEWKRNYLLVPESAHGLENCEFQGHLDMLVIVKKISRKGIS